MASVEGTRRRLGIGLRASVLAAALAAVATFAGTLPSAHAASGDTAAGHASAAFTHFLSEYWDGGARLFGARSDGRALSSTGTTRPPGWWVAQLWETVMDEYERTGDNSLKPLIDDIYEGWTNRYGINSDYNDDRGWWALAATRAFNITHESRYLNLAIKIADGQWNYWDSTFGGGIWWKRSTKDQKNVATNGTAAIVNATLYRYTGASRFKKHAVALFNWVDSKLRSGGRLDDRIEKPNNRIQVDYTYNYGSYIGAALGLFRITGSSTYLNKATSLADSALSRLVNSNGVLRSEGTGDGGGFKGIFMRNLRWLVTAGAVPSSRKSAYASFIGRNADVAWSHRISARLWGPNWAKYTSLPVEVLTDASAVSLFEADALTP
jgi:predicted alpha-1,6-mannanase (GH76 family)